MKILYLSGTALPSRAANSVHVMKMCSAFAALGHEVILAVRHAGDPEFEGENPYLFYNVPASFVIERFFYPQLPLGLGEYYWAWCAARHARRAKPDLVYGRSTVGCLVAARSGFACVYEAHKTISAMGRVPAAAARRLLVHDNLRRLTVLSRILAKDFRESFSVEPERMVVAYNGADPPAEGPPWAGPFVANDRLKVGYAGQLYPGKGVELIGQIAPECPWAHFFIVGGGKTEVDQWHQRISSIENLTLLGHVPQQELDGFRAAMDVLLVPPRAMVGVAGGSGFSQALSPPLKLFESLASAKPIICSDFLDEVVTDQRDALLADPAQPKQWIDALERLRDDSQLRARLGKAARARFDADLSWNARARRVLHGLTL